MRILLHICCGPCAIFPVRRLREGGHELTGFFHNPNIHPFQEFRRRLEALETMAGHVGLAVEYDRDYGLQDYLRQVVFREEERCRLCYRMRLLRVAARARELGAEAFSTTLLYSRYQRHELIRAVAGEVAGAVGVAFHYEDWRPGWQEGIDGAIGLGLYRQPYCGCIYSEQERYDRSLRQKQREAGAEGGPREEGPPAKDGRQRLPPAKGGGRVLKPGGAERTRRSVPLFFR